MTSGPADASDRSVSVGEAAHIYGARPGSARYLESMADAERSNVTNGIWLCRNCHKLVDADPDRFPAELLFEWRRSHERSVSERLGKSDALRQRVLDRALAEFEGCTYLAQQIVIDKPDHWELRLTAELLRSSLAPILRRWKDLERGLYAKPQTRISEDACWSWFQTQLANAGAQTHALSVLVNEEIMPTWGPPGQPGSAHEILRVCGLITEACQRILDWEEQLKFAALPEHFEELRSLFLGVAGAQIERVAEIPTWIIGLFADGTPTGEHSLMIVLKLPQGWSENVEAAMERAARHR